MSFGGPGSAFSFAAPTRPTRRNGSYSNSLAGGGGASGGHSNATAIAPSTQNGPAPVDPPANPSLGSWSTSNSGTTSPRQREDSNNSTSDPVSAAPRSFSSILSPSLAANGAHAHESDYLNGVGGTGGGFSGKVKPFVYSREFLLSLYDDEKAKKRPLELAVHDMATRDLSGNDAPDHKPWALQEYRQGEKDLFSISIHPANARPSRMNRTDSSLSNSQGTGTPGANGTLDLSTLGTLPRDRDRALGSPSIRSPSIPGAEAGLGRERRTRERSAGSGTIGILGGVLGGIAPVASPVSRKKDGEASKEVWQGGRWRRGQVPDSEDIAEKRPSAFGSRRFPLAEDGKSADREDNEAVPDAWDQSTKEEATPTGSAGLNGSSLNSSTDSLPAEADLTASVLGSLALDSDPLEDSLLSNKPVHASGTSTPSRIAPPPGLASIPPAEVNWQYRDPSGQVQGPFSAQMMHEWYLQQFFQSDLRVKRTSDLDFETLADLIRRTGDSEKPFLAPKPSILSAAPGSAFSSAPGTPQLSSAWGAPRAQTPLEQLAGSLGQSRFAAPGGIPGAATPSFYEPFGSNAGSPSIQSQVLGGRGVSTPGGTALDPWGTPLPSVTSPALQQLFAQQQQQQHQQIAAAQSPLIQHGIPSSVDVLRQLQQQHQQAQSPSFAPQYAGHLAGTDVFGRPSPLPTPSYFDPRHLANGSPAQPQAPTAWIGQQPQPHHHQQQPVSQHLHQQQQQQQQPWSNLGSPAVQPQQTASSAVASPIGPPAAASQQPLPQPSGEAKVELAETVVVGTNIESKEPVVVAVVEEVKVVQPDPIGEQAQHAVPAKKSKKESKEAKAAAPAPAPAPEPTPASSQPQAEDSTPSSPSVAPSVDSSSTAAKAPAVAPWAKDESISPVGTGAQPSPSLREIQQAEAREADKRKAAARIQAAQANIQAAQRAAAAEAALASEQLPSAANWAAGPAQVPATKPAAAAPWTKPAAPVAKSSGKTLKEIQEEEEKRKKAQLAAQQQAQGGSASFVGKGYAGSVQTANKANPSAPWTTVAVKPAVVHVAAASKPIIPGLPSAGSVVVQPAASRPAPVTSASSVSKPPAAPTTTVRPTAVSTASASAISTKPSVIRSISVNGGSSSSPQVYDAENPPPPSAEFVAWIRQALKGLQVPMDEFISVLLSFPLDASSDVLEIISDSVYANSSTLDGRRFANDYAARRKNDVAVRYPQIFAKGKVMTKSAIMGGAPVSMAQALATPQQGKPAEWSVKVSGGKKKKGTK